MRLRFTKMQGLGNDFVMLDGVSQKLKLNQSDIQKIADRHFGVGCDQVLLVEAPQAADVDFRYRIFNCDGTEVENCGNGARCFAQFVTQLGLTVKKKISVETLGGQLTLEVLNRTDVQVNMGFPQFKPGDIPFLADKRSTCYALSLEDEDAELEVSVLSMGNPHAVCVVDDVDNYPVARLGALVENHSQFPEKVNAGFMQILSRQAIKCRVFERGVGETQACGTGACAAMVTGRIRNLLDQHVTVQLTGGQLTLEWEGEGKPVIMTGPAAIVFQGQIRL